MSISSLVFSCKMYMFILAEADRCVNRILRAKTEGSISGVLTRQPLRRGNRICSLYTSEYSVIELKMNRYTCTSGCSCNRWVPTYVCYPITIIDSQSPLEFNLSSTTPKYIYTNAADIFIESSPDFFHSFSPVIKYNITYRGE